MDRLLVAGCVFFLLLESCNSPKKSGSTIRVVPDNETIDSLDYFSKDYTVTHIANEKRIEGVWSVNSMYRTPNSSAEKLTDVMLDFSSGSFSGKAPCNRVSGKYKIKDFKISFSGIVATKMACSKLEIESVYLKLLEGSVDNFTFNRDRLVLKDSKSNLVFECTKQ